MMPRIESKFANFMEETLYGENGFYTKGGGAGRHRDYLTSPEIGDLFGQVIAGYIDNWFANLDEEYGIVIDAGCGPGSLVASIARANFANAANIEFVLVDRSPEHRLTAEKKLTRVASGLTWSVHETIPQCNSATLIITNELLDNLVFNIGTTSDVYRSYRPDNLERMFESPASGRSGDVDRLGGASVPIDIADFRIPLHVGIAQWIEEMLDATMQVSNLSLLFFDYMKSVTQMQDGDWLRLYADNRRIVGIDKVLDALYSGAVGDITCDITEEDLHLLLDQAGFSKIRIESQHDWLKTNGIDNYCGDGPSSSPYDQLVQFTNKEPQLDMTTSFIKEREILVDENGLGSFGVLSAKREI